MVPQEMTSLARFSVSCVSLLGASVGTGSGNQTGRWTGRKGGPEVYGAGVADREGDTWVGLGNRMARGQSGTGRAVWHSGTYPCHTCLESGGFLGQGKDLARTRQAGRVGPTRRGGGGEGDLEVGPPEAVKRNGMVRVRMMIISVLTCWG